MRDIENILQSLRTVKDDLVYVNLKMTLPGAHKQVHVHDDGTFLLEVHEELHKKESFVAAITPEVEVKHNDHQDLCW